jgi:hypothetical protein
MLTTNEKGMLAEAAVIFECAKLGVPVLRPLGDQRYDLALDLGRQILRVQCKWAVQHDDVIVIRTRTCRRTRDGLIHRPYEPGEIDAIAAYCAQTQRCYFLPTEYSVSRGAVQLRLEPTKNNQTLGINWARDFDFAATMERLLGP